MAYDALDSVIRPVSDVHAPDLARLRLDVERMNRSYQAARYEGDGPDPAGPDPAGETAARTCP